MGPFTAVYENDGDWIMAYIEELPGANTQGKTLEEARENLREAVTMILQANRELAEAELKGHSIIRKEPLVVNY